MTDSKFSIVCLSSQDWHAELPTNRHQVMLRAAERGHRVVFVETGHFLGKHVLKLLRSRHRLSLARRLAAGEEVAPGVFVRKALNVLPWGKKYELASRANCAATAFLLRRLARELPEPPVLWLYDPSCAGLVGSCGEAFAVYDCVDDYAEQAGSNGRRRAFAAASDARAAEVSKVVFATTTPLRDRHLRANANTHLVRNVGDYAHFAPAASRSFATPDVRDVPQPVVGFAGNLVPSKVDFDLLETIALARPDWSLLLVGPVGERADARLAQLTTLPNIRWVGPRPYREVPRYVAAFDVGVIPYVSNAYTRSCFPLKVYEYLAAGKPVVASGLPELAGMEPDVRVAASAPEFVEAVEDALGRRGDGDRARRMHTASSNTWDTRTSRLLELIEMELGLPAATQSPAVRVA